MNALRQWWEGVVQRWNDFVSEIANEIDESEENVRLILRIIFFGLCTAILGLVIFVVCFLVLGDASVWLLLPLGMVVVFRIAAE